MPTMLPTLAAPPLPAAAAAAVSPASGLTLAPPFLRLLRVRVRDFRGVEDATLDLGDVTVVMGENNVGKSAILEALDVALGDRFASSSDLRVSSVGAASPRFVIDMELSPWSGLMLNPSAIDLLGVTYRPEPGTGRQRYFLRAVGEPDDTNRTVRVRRGIVGDWNAPPDGPFLAEIDAGQRRSMWFSLLGAQRDLLDDLRVRSSPWGKLLRRLQLDEPSRKKFEQQLAQLSAQVMQALPDSTRLATALSRLQSVLAGQVSQARLALLPNTLGELWRTTDLLIQPTGHPELSIGQQGMGARSLSSLLAFRAWLEAEIAISVEPPVLVVTAFEEPESHLHPQAQRAVFGEIGAVAGQRIISTHSPYVASVANLDDFRVIRRNQAVTVRSAQGISSDPAVSAEGLAKVRRFCLSRNGDMVFARLVILGEGDTEAGVLPEIARSWFGVAPEVRGITIVQLEGVGNARTFAGFLERLGIPWIVLVDGDAEGQNERARMLAVPTLAPLVPTRVHVVHDGKQPVDFEGLIASSGRAAALRALHFAKPNLFPVPTSATTAAIADALRSQKATLSRRLGEELATDWSTRAAFPKALSDLFTFAETLLPP